ncbi:unnamed protein product, partial [Porites evermanni]
KGIFVDLDVCSHHTTWRSHCIEFQVDSGCLCNTMHITDLGKLSDVKVMPSPTRLFHYSKATIPTKGQAKLNCSHQGSSYELVVQIITSQQYYPPLLGLADSTCMCTLKNDADKVNQPIQAISHRFSAPKLPIIKEALDKVIENGQLVPVTEATQWVFNTGVGEHTDSKPAKVRICLDPSQTKNGAIIRPVYPIPT